MVAIDGGISQLAAGELVPIQAGVGQVGVDTGEVGDHLVVGVVLHQEKIRQGAVILAGGSGDELGLDVAVDVLFNVQLEVGVVLLVDSLRLLQSVDVEVGIPCPYGQGLVAVSGGVGGSGICGGFRCGLGRGAVSGRGGFAGGTAAAANQQRCCHSCCHKCCCILLFHGFFLLKNVLRLYNICPTAGHKLSGVIQHRRPSASRAEPASGCRSDAP